MTKNSDDSRDGPYSDAWRARIAADLEAYRAQEQRLWGGIDELLLARYEAGVCTHAERVRVEQAMDNFPAIRKSVEIARALAVEWQADAPSLAPEIPVPASHNPTDKPALPETAWPLTIQFDATEQTLLAARRREPKPMLRRLAVAAAVLAIAVGLTYHYARPRNAPGPQQANQQTGPVPKEPIVIVDYGKKARKPTSATLEDALADLEKRVAAGIGPEELRKTYDRLLKDFPAHQAEIERNPLLAKALAPAPPPPEKLIATTPPGESPPPVTVIDRDGLLTRIADFAGKPLAVGEARVRELREQVLRYRQQHPEPKIPKFEAFALASEPTARNELLHAEARARELTASPKESAEIRELRTTILTLRLREDARPLFDKSKALAEFMKLKQPDDPAAKAAEMKTVAVALVDRLSQPKEKGPYLLCVLPPGIRGEAVELYNSVQALARKPGQLTDASLVDFLTRARRPVVQDTMGMIIPLYIYPDRNNFGSWDQVMALANQGVRIKIVINPNIDDIREADPNYTEAIDRVRAVGIEVLGRVSCLGGPAGLAKAQQQVMVYRQYYPNIDGMFFADQDTALALIDPYAALYRYARGLGCRQVVACPGSSCDEAFLTRTGADMLCPSVTRAAPNLEAWSAKYDPSKLVALIENVTDETIIPGLLLDAVDKHYGWIFIGGSEPFKSMPPYLGPQLRWIQEMNHLILNGKDSVAPRRTDPAASQKRGTRKSP